MRSNIEGVETIFERVDDNSRLGSYSFRSRVGSYFRLIWTLEKEEPGEGKARDAAVR